MYQTNMAQLCIPLAKRLSRTWGALWRRIGRELVAVAFGQAVMLVGSLVVMKVLTSRLDPVAYGDVALANTLVSLCGLMFFGPLANSCTRFWSICRERLQSPLLLVITGKILGIAALVLVGVGGPLLMVFGWTPLRHWIPLVIIALLLALLTGYNSVLTSLHVAARRRILVAVCGGSQPWLFAMFALGMFHVFGAASGSALWGSIVAAFVVFSVQTGFLIRPFRHGVREGYAASTASALQRELLGFAYPFMATGIVSWAQSSGDRWALLWVAGPESVGRYSVLFQIGYYPMMLLSGALIQFVYPIVLDRVGDGRDWERVRSGLRTLTWTVLSFSAACVVGLMLIVVWHAPLLRLTTGQQYWSASYLLWGIFLSSSLMSLSQFFGLIPMVFGNPGRLVAPKAVTAVVGIVLNVVLGKQYGLVGVIAAGAGVSVVYAGWLAWIAYSSVCLARISAVASLSAK